MEIPERLSRLAREAGVKHCSVLTSKGANASSWFLYLKTKGQVNAFVCNGFQNRTVLLSSVAGEFFEGDGIP